ncbi:MAG: DUF2961 domain-containing protein [Chloroflexi bacterium]|nr:DUF2961 domain-containing protein [Chloroflexota bacterium]
MRAMFQLDRFAGGSRRRVGGVLLTLVGIALGSAACAVVPIPTITPAPIASPRPVTTPQSAISADLTPSPAATSTATVSVAEPTATPLPASFLQQHIADLFDLSHLPALENTIATQFTSRNWVSLEHYFDYFVDDGNFAGPNYGYIDENGVRRSYRIVRGYDGQPEYEIVPRVQGPGYISRVWFAYQQHQSLNNPTDMSQSAEWANWGNLGQMGNIRFYFDDETTPRIDFGIKDLFVGKQPFLAPLAAFYASADGGNINYVPIPFQRSIRVTTTGRPRLMQVEVKQLVSSPSAAASTRVAGGSSLAFSPAPVSSDSIVQSFSLATTPAEDAVLIQAAQAWQSCDAKLPGNFNAYALSIPHNNSAEVDFAVPSTIAGLRVRVPRGMDDSVWMQIFWDGETVPSISGPLRAMFGTAELILPYRSLPLGIVAGDAETMFYNNFPMPFRSARFVFLNDRAETLPLTFEVVATPTVPGTEHVRFHEFYGTRRMDAREDDGDNYSVIDVKGSGKFLGMILSAWDLDRRALNGPIPQTWRFPYLESNVDVWVDDRLALPGTGIEDDFDASYYYVYAGYPGYKATYCLAGVTLLDYSTPKEPSSQYRFYLDDAPEFHNQLRVEVQHGNKGNNLSVTYSSTAFWYQVR